MKRILALLWVIFFLPSVLAGDYMIQDIPSSFSQSANVVMSNGNYYTVVNGYDAYVQQSVEFDHTSYNGYVDQYAYNLVDVSGTASTDYITIYQSITETGDSYYYDVDQTAWNEVYGDLGYDAYVSQYINQYASAGSYASQYAENEIIGDLNGDYGTVYQNIDQTAFGYYGADQSANYYANYIGDINCDYFYVDQSIDQEAFSYGWADQYAVYAMGNEIGDINGWAGTATQSIYQAAEAYDSVYQDASNYGNYIYDIYGSNNAISQDITQVALSDYGYVEQYADSNANYIDEIAYADYNTVTQNILQAGLGAGNVYQYADTNANTIEYGIYDAWSNTIDQEITQAGVGYDVYQYANYYANYVPDVYYGDYLSLTQGILQLGLASDVVTQEADYYANYVNYIDGYDITLYQTITQAGVSSNDVYQYADTGNELYYGSYGDYHYIGQTILQLASAYDYVYQDAYNEIDGPIYGDYANVEQELIQAAAAYAVDQYADEGNYLYETAGYEPYVYQAILQVAGADWYVNQYADYGNEISYLYGDYASANQYITQATVASDVYQDGANLIYYGSDAYLYIGQEVYQAASADYLDQYAYNDIDNSYLYDDASIYQTIYSYADWGYSLYQDMENYAYLAGPSYAFVDQYIDAGTSFNGGSWYQENYIDNQLSYTLTAYQTDLRNGIDVDNNYIV